ncbi:MAG: methyl-accepting chemotaxis protein [Nitrospira sp.]|nr:methyl-accepting chemotaxis protein [Nitrospira sp.]
MLFTAAVISLFFCIGFRGVTRLKQTVTFLDSGPVSALAQVSMSGNNLALYHSALSGMGRYTSKVDFAGATARLAELKRQTLASLDFSEGDGKVVGGIDTSERKRLIVLQQSLKDYFASAEGALKIVADSFDESLSDDQQQPLRELGLRAIARDVAAKQQKVTVQIHELMIKLRESARDATDRAQAEAEGYRQVLVLMWVWILAAVGLGYLLVRRVSRRIRRLGDVAAEAVAGNLCARACVEGHDDLGRLGKSLNILLEQMAALTLAEQERDRLQRRLAQVQALISSVRKGDLITPREVPSDACGPLVQEINGLIQQVTHLFLQVRHAVQRMGESADMLREQADQLKDAGRRHVGGSRQVMEAMEQWIGALHRVSEVTRALTESQKEALLVVERGRILVEERSRKLEGVRSSLQQEIARLKMLGCRMADIDRLVLVLQELVDRVNLVVMNQPLETTAVHDKSEESMRRVMSLVPEADYAAKLEGQLREVVRDLRSVTALVQGEANDVVETLEQKTTDGAEKELSMTLEEAFALLLSVIREMSNLAGTLATTLAEQVAAIAATGQFIKDIVEDAKVVQGVWDQTTEVAQSLEKLADSLNAPVSRFTLA